MYLKIIIAMLFTTASIYSMENFTVIPEGDFTMRKIDGKWLLVKMCEHIENTQYKKRRDGEVARLRAQSNKQEQPIVRRVGIVHGNICERNFALSKL